MGSGVETPQMLLLDGDDSVSQNEGLHDQARDQSVCSYEPGRRGIRVNWFLS